MVNVPIKIIKAWFERRFHRKPEHDSEYFKEWVERFARAETLNEIYPMDSESRRVWEQVRKEFKP